MDTKFFKKIEKKYIKSRADVRVGDTVKLHLKIVEKEKERTQIFEGVIIAIKGKLLNRTITVRRMASGIGVERIVPLHSPLLEKIEIIKRGKPRRSKLYYMRKREGKRALGIPKEQAVYFADMEEEGTEDTVNAENTDEEKQNDKNISNDENKNKNEDNQTENADGKSMKSDNSEVQ